MVPDEREPAVVVDEEGVRGAVTGPRHHPEVPAAGADPVAVGEADVGAPGVRRLADVIPERLVGVDDTIRHAVMAHQRVREAPVGLGARRVALAVGGGPVQGGDRGTRAGGDGRGQAGVVEMVMREHDELELLDPHARAPQAGLQRRQGICGVRTRVHQGQRVAAQQPGVHRPDVRQRDRDLDDVLHGLGILNRLQVWQTIARLVVVCI